MPNVAFVRKEVKELNPIYNLVNDCAEGDFKIKSKGDVYLPRPNETDVSLENQARYKAYLNRAVFYNVTKATFVGLLGQIFSKNPIIELPNELKYLENNCDGSGKGLVQFSKEGVGNLLKNSRFGLFIDYPNVDSPMSATELEERKIRPFLKMFESKNIINWRTKEIGSEIVYSLIVLKDTEIYSDDGFEFKERNFYRVLRLDESNKYTKEIWRENENKLFYSEGIDYPTDFNGNRLERIPFEFCGAEDNDAMPDVPVLYDIAVLNIGHYRNSADYEESCFITGQPTPYFTGLTEEWISKVLKGTIQLGSRAAVPLPEGGSAGLLQSNANIQPIEAMKHKEEQFLALGAKLVSPNSTKTATEASIKNTSETSVLSNLSNNCSIAFENAIKTALLFVKSSSEKVSFVLNTDFEISKMSTAERSQLLNEWMRGAISFNEYRTNLRQSKLELQDDKLAKKEINAEALQNQDTDLDNA